MEEEIRKKRPAKLVEVRAQVQGRCNPYIGLPSLAPKPPSDNNEGAIVKSTSIVY